MYEWIKLLHVLSAVLSIGPYFVLLPMIPKLRKAEADQLKPYMDSFRFTVWLTKHAGHLLVISGVLLIWQGNWPWTTSWLVLSIAILMSALFFLARAFSPILKKLNEPGHDRNELVNKLQRALVFYLGIMIFVLGLMVLKPALW